jgi:hypothetical protein
LAVQGTTGNNLENFEKDYKFTGSKRKVDDPVW